MVLVFLIDMLKIPGVVLPLIICYDSLGAVRLRKSKRKFGWARTDFVDFAG